MALWDMGIFVKRQYDEVGPLYAALIGCYQITFTRLDIDTFASLLTIKLVMHT